jgi:hypothetical protein
MQYLPKIQIERIVLYSRFKSGILEKKFLQKIVCPYIYHNFKALIRTRLDRIGKDLIPISLGRAR